MPANEDNIQRASDVIPNQDLVEDVVDSRVAEGSTQAHIPNAVAAAGATPTKAEYDALVAKFNLVLGVLRDIDALPSS